MQEGRVCRQVGRVGWYVLYGGGGLVGGSQGHAGRYTHRQIKLLGQDAQEVFKYK